MEEHAWEEIRKSVLVKTPKSTFSFFFPTPTREMQKLHKYLSNCKTVQSNKDSDSERETTCFLWSRRMSPRDWAQCCLMKEAGTWPQRSRSAATSATPTWQWKTHRGSTIMWHLWHRCCQIQLCKPSWLTCSGRGCNWEGETVQIPPLPPRCIRNCLSTACSPPSPGHDQRNKTLSLYSQRSVNIC